MENKEKYPIPGPNEEICPHYKEHAQYDFLIKQVDCNIQKCPYRNLDITDIKSADLKFKLCKTRGLVSKI